MPKHNWLIGTSGFMTSQKNWFEQTNLNCIEINSTFYRLPTSKAIHLWNQFPREVAVVLKVPRYITHTKRLLEFETTWQPFWDVVRDLKPLQGFLFQFPPSFKNTTVNLERIQAMRPFLPKTIPIIIEFRDISWFDDSIYEAMAALNICVASVLLNKTDKTPTWLGTMPDGLTLTPAINNTTYLRVHGGKGNRGFYTREALQAIYDQISQFGAKRNYALFNNTFFNTRNERCALNDNIRYAAICDAMIWSHITQTNT